MSYGEPLMMWITDSDYYDYLDEERTIQYRLSRNRDHNKFKKLLDDDESMSMPEFVEFLWKEIMIGKDDWADYHGQSFMYDFLQIRPAVWCHGNGNGTDSISGSNKKRKLG